MIDEIMYPGGFSLAKILLSNALPASLYYPYPPDHLRSKQDAPPAPDSDEDKS